MKVIAVIVTYNRLALLKQCLSAVLNQTRLADEIIVVNNGSTDQTLSWLTNQPVKHYTQENSGGAGGFAFGIKKAFEHQADWIWVMDDDTIPNASCLEKLLSALSKINSRNDNVGFLASKVLWTNGDLHEMNLTYSLKDKEKLAVINWRGPDDWPLVQFGTFVSLLISGEVVGKLGLPIKEYFIWNDDVEYTKRIVNAGFAGLAVSDSVAIHATPVNHMSSVFKDGPENLWKYHYGMRNELCTKRYHQGALQFWITWFHRMLLMPFRIALARKDYRWSFIKVIWQTSIAAISFHPRIERVSR